ncbi:MAG: hypothetical protein JWQ87_4319 [Candidatus Sulfotelmatobacter sp.]|nr:hypothetical protein [Candidatus Sulfotelmatobacter sp.]
MFTDTNGFSRQTAPRPRRNATLAAFNAGAIAICLMLPHLVFSASTEQLLHVFQQGDLPWAGVTFDKAGNLYGTSAYGGAFKRGGVFKLTRTATGWRYSILYSFKGGTDAETPYAGVTFDSAGNLYGTTPNGGAYNNGTVYELSPAGDGSWKETILYSFKGNGDGRLPVSGIVIDRAGTLYGSVSQLGDNSCDYFNGGIYQLKHSSTGWRETLVHRFCGVTNGWSPGPITLDQAGNIYGGAGGGTNKQGLVYMLTRNGTVWNESVLAEMTFAEGNPVGALVFDLAGNLYGVGSGGTAGTIFELSPSAGGWHLNLLYSFTGGLDGALPTGLVIDAKGTLYGVTSEYGEYGVYGGTAFSLSPGLNGQWVQTVLHSFGDVNDGYSPYDVLTLDGKGNLYGTTSTGTVSCCLYGTVFKIIP